MTDRAPQVVYFVADLHVHLVEVPAPLAKALHPVHPLTADIGCNQWSEPVSPVPNGFMAEVDPALEQQVLDVAQ